MAKLSIVSKELGRGKGERTTFSTLKEAQNFIKDYWQGVEYIDSASSFHSDYCTFECVGFKLSDVGRYRRCKDWFEWDWIDLDAKPEEMRPLEIQFYSAFERFDVKQEETNPPPF